MYSHFLSCTGPYSKFNNPAWSVVEYIQETVTLIRSKEVFLLKSLISFPVDRTSFNIPQYRTIHQQHQLLTVFNIKKTKLHKHTLPGIPYKNHLTRFPCPSTHQCKKVRKLGHLNPQSILHTRYSHGNCQLCDTFLSNENQTDDSALLRSQWSRSGGVCRSIFFMEQLVSVYSWLLTRDSIFSVFSAPPPPPTLT